MGVMIENPEKVRQAELVVGIPSFNEAASIAYPTKMASIGLLKYFPNKESVIINVDNNSLDGTKDAFLNTPTKVPKIYLSTPGDLRGKGNNLKNLFEAVVELRASAAIVIDADLKSITPQWIQYLGEPLFSGFNYVTPIYVRHKYDGSITNHIAYPLLRTLFGLRVRQPIGGDFGFSRRLAQAFLSEKTWTENVAHFGIDIWMTTIAIARRFKVCQTYLGSPKSHRTKDPATHLGPMFTQVMMAFFELMIDFEYFWKDTTESWPSSIFGFGLGGVENPPPVSVDLEALYKSFISGFDRYGEVWKKILPKPEWTEINKTKKISKEQFYYHSDLWARILFSYAIAYRNNEISKDLIIESMIPFYHSRILSFVNKTIQMDTKECEEYFESIVRIFEDEKPYLIKRWDEDQRKLGNKLFRF
ncbi:MAG: glycosyl transferase [Candidatus Aminicenantes bacterium]|nr:glycosyl transferase [Candidatus Aminicenantes bacterium]